MKTSAGPTGVVFENRSVGYALVFILYVISQSNRVMRPEILQLCIYCDEFALGRSNKRNNLDATTQVFAHQGHDAKILRQISRFPEISMQDNLRIRRRVHIWQVSNFMCRFWKNH